MALGSSPKLKNTNLDAYATCRDAQFNPQIKPMPSTSLVPCVLLKNVFEEEIWEREGTRPSMFESFVDTCSLPDRFV